MKVRVTTRHEHTGNRQLDQMQRETKRVADRTNDCPFVAGHLVTGLVFTAGASKTIDHGLSRAPRGCFVVRSYGANAAPPPVESATQPSDHSRQIALETTVDATFDIWFW